MSAAAEAEISWLWDLVHPAERDASLGTVLVAQRAEEGAPEGTTLFVASTDDEDRALDVVKQDWALRNFRANPVILDNHKSLRVVGKGVEAKVPRAGDDAGRLMIRVAWDLAAPDPSIATVGHQHLNGFRSAGSVGFRHGKKTQRDKLPADHQYFRQPETISVSGFFGDYEFEHAGFLFEKNELFEFSSASIPMNPNALQRSLLVELGHLDPEDVEGRARVVGQTVPRAVAADLAGWLADPVNRASALDLLWPDILQRIREDQVAHRIFRALQIPGGPPAAPAPADPPIPFASRVARLLEESR